MTTTKTFKEAYAEITEMSVKQVDLVLEIQDKQDAKYSRVKTCKGLWKIAHAAGAESARENMQVEIDKRDALLREMVERVNISENLIVTAGDKIEFDWKNKALDILKDKKI